SCCWSPEALREYFEVHACGAPGDHHGEVIVFEGEHVGQGDDGEPLAVPTRVVDRLPWSAYDANSIIREEVSASSPRTLPSGSRRSPRPLRPATKPKSGSLSLSPSGRGSCSPCTPSTGCRSDQSLPCWQRRRCRSPRQECRSWWKKREKSGEGPALADYWRQHDMKKAVWSGERIGLPPVRYPLAALVGANTRDTSTPWVAEIVGLSAKYGYERRFLRGKEDWTRANSPGSRGVYFYF